MRRDRRRGPARLMTLLLALLAPLALAVGYRALTLEEIWADAEIVVFGTVDAVTVEAREGEPWTRVAVDPERLLEGGGADGDEDEGEPAAEELLEFWALGGELPSGEALTVAEMPRFEEGERVLLALYDDDALASPIVGFRQGLWRLGSDGLTDPRGRRLSVADGELLRNGDEGGLEDVLDAVAAALDEEAP